MNVPEISRRETYHKGDEQKVNGLHSDIKWKNINSFKSSLINYPDNNRYIFV